MPRRHRRSIIENQQPVEYTPLGGTGSRSVVSYVWVCWGGTGFTSSRNLRPRLPGKNTEFQNSYQPQSPVLNPQPPVPVYHFMFRLITPHYRVYSVQELTPERLQLWGLSALLLDVDCTLTRYRRGDPTAEVLAWIAQVRTAGIRLCLVSNGMGHRIHQFAERLGLPCVANAMKPLPWGIRSAVRKLNSEPSQTAMVGDQLFADVMAARLAGVRSILVHPIHPEEEPWFTRLKRWPERLALDRLSRSSPDLNMAGPVVDSVATR